MQLLLCRHWNLYVAAHLIRHFLALGVRHVIALGRRDGSTDGHFLHLGLKNGMKKMQVNQHKVPITRHSLALGVIYIIILRGRDVSRPRHFLQVTIREQFQNMLYMGRILVQIDWIRLVRQEKPKQTRSGKFAALLPDSPSGPPWWGWWCSRSRSRWPGTPGSSSWLPTLAPTKHIG